MAALKIKTCFLRFLALTILVSAILPDPAFAGGQVINLGSLGGGFTKAYGISRDGTKVVGVSNTLYGQQHAFLWSEKKGMIDLHTLLNVNHSLAYGISADGKVVVGVAYWYSNDLDYHAFRWTQETGMVDLGTLGGPSSCACSVSANGTVVVGYSELNLKEPPCIDPYQENYVRWPFRWTTSTKMVSLTPFYGAIEYMAGAAHAVSANGKFAVGESFWDTGNFHLGEEDYFRACRWDDLQKMPKPFDSLERDTRAIGISANGRAVVGYAPKGKDDEGVPIADIFYWSNSGGIRYLTEYRGSYTGGWCERDLAVSADGKVVVGEGVVGHYYGTGFRWTEAGGLQTLREWLDNNSSLPSPPCAVSEDGKVVAGGAYLAREGDYKVLLVHGIWDSAKTCWIDTKVVESLEKEGFPVSLIDFCPNNDAIENNAKKLAEKISSMSRPGERINIVAHSMGGLAVRYYLAHQEELWPTDKNGKPEHRVKKLITLGTPHLGTDMHLLHPVASTVAEYRGKECNESCNKNVPLYHYKNWSPGIKDMTAVIKPPSMWTDGKGRQKHVMGLAERAAPSTFFTQPDADWVWYELDDDFFNNKTSKESLQNHINYYNSMVEELTQGKGSSPFLESLNRPGSIPHDIDYYLVYGTNRRVIFEPVCHLFPLKLLAADYGDGAVHPDSASGKGLDFGTKFEQIPVNLPHLELRSDGKAHKIILEKLKAEPL